MAGFAAELVRLGYRRTPATFQLQLMAHASRWLRSEGLGADGLTSDVVERFLAERRAAGYTNYVTGRAIAPLLGYLRGLGVAPPASPRLAVGAVEVQLADYREYLAVERALTADTIEGYALAVRPFLDGRLRDGDELDLGGLSAADVVAFVVARCPAQSRGAAKMTVTGLRSLLRFLHLRGVVSGPLADVVPSTASWRLSGLPRALEPEQLDVLLACCDCGAPTGRRDYAVLVMLARLGLRAGEVAALKLEDVDWRAGELVIAVRVARRPALREESLDDIAPQLVRAEPLALQPAARMRHQLQLKDDRRRPVAQPRKLRGKPRREHLQRARRPNPRRILHDALPSVVGEPSVDQRRWIMPTTAPPIPLFATTSQPESA